MSPTGEIEVTVTATITRRVRLALFILRFAGRRLRYRPSEERLERIAGWLVDGCEFEVGPPQIKPSPRP